MRDQCIDDALAEVRLPPSYSWGDWSGDYRKIMKGDRVICRVGGVTLKVDSKCAQGYVCREIMRGEYEWGQTDAVVRCFDNEGVRD